MSKPMAQVRYQHLINDKDRHGNVRWYVRIKGHKKVRIREEAGSEAFTAAYHAAVSSIKEPQVNTNPVHVGRNSFEWLVNQYYQSAAFQRGADATKKQRRNILGRICAEHGHMPMDIPRKSIRAGRDARAATPGAANNYLKTMKALYAWAVEQEHIDENPVIGVTRLRPKHSNGFHTWTPAQCLAYERAHPLGTMARLAYAIALYTGARRSDVVRLGRQHMSSGTLAWNQFKSAGKNTERVEVPILPELRDAIDAMPMTGMHFITTAHGKPFSVAGFGNRFKEWAREANLPNECAIHGLRKALGARLAEGGATENEIAAALGHAGTSTAKIYTRKANQKRLAKAAMSTLQDQSVPPSGTEIIPVGQKRGKQ